MSLYLFRFLSETSRTHTTSRKMESMKAMAKATSIQVAKLFLAAQTTDPPALSPCKYRKFLNKTNSRNSFDSTKKSESVNESSEFSMKWRENLS